MKKTLALTLTVALLTIPAVGASKKSNAQNDKDRQAIAAIRDSLMAAMNSGDVDKHLSLYTRDVVLMPPDEPAVVGIEAVTPWIRNMYKEFKIEGRFLSIDELTISGDWAFERARFVLKATPVSGGPSAVLNAKGIHVFHREHGVWKEARDVWNSEKPEVQQPAN